MPLEISSEILDRSNLCVRGRACLEGEKNFCCRVRDVVKGKEEAYLTVQCHGHMDCPYCQAFGSSSLCFCPARMEIYRRYRM